MIHEFSYAVRLSRRFKCVNTPISVGVIMNSGRYLCISIPTIKCCNLSSYEEIPTCKSYSYEDPKYPCHQLQGHLCTWKSIERRNQIREVVNNIIFCWIHYNQGTIVNSLSSLRGFSQFDFSRKNLLSPPVYYVEIFNYNPIIEILSRLWCEVDCQINRVRKSPPH